MSVDQLPDLNAGWVHLLPPNLLEKRVLCIDAGSGSSAQALQYWCGSVTCWSPAGPGCASLPFESGSFDLVVCRLLDSEQDADAVRALIKDCARVLSPQGCFYVDVDSRSWPARLRLRTRLTGWLQAGGLTQIRSWPLLLERGVIAEILPPGGYRSCRNSWRPVEKLKAWIYGPAAPWLAPGHAFLASRKPLPPGWLDGLGNGAGEGRFSQFIVNPAKSFFQPAGQSLEEIPLLYVLPGDERTVARRRTEFATIARLKSAGLGMVSYLPRISEERMFRGSPVFAMEAIDGVTVDLPVPRMDELFEAAFAVLLSFNRETAHPLHVDAPLFEKMTGLAARVAIERYPVASTELQTLLATVKDCVLGTSCTVVWMHGDYKLENLIFNRVDRSVHAVIDWELAGDAGLPWLDLLYLLAYREITLDRATDILEVMEQVLDGRCALFDVKLLDAYRAVFPLSARDHDLAWAVFFLHHIGARFSYDPEAKRAMDRIKRLAGGLVARLCIDGKGTSGWA